MKVACGFFTFFLLVVLRAVAVDLDVVRQKYPLAATDKAVCRQMIDLLQHQKDESSVYLAYLGAFQAIWAAHTWNPAQKLSTFHKGKDHIEKAVKADPDNMEIRFIRYTIQLKSPKFLGYQDHLESDKAFVNAHRKQISNPLLKEMIRNTLD